MENTLEVTAKNDYQQEVQPMVRWAQGLTIQNDQESLSAQQQIKEIKRRIDVLHPKFDEPVRAAFQSHKKAKELYNLVVGQLKDAAQIAGRAVAVYVDKKEREAKAEADRLEAERRERERKEQEKLEKRAEKAEAKGQTEKADQLRDQAQQVYVPPSAPAPAQPAAADGASFRTVWKGEVTNIVALCQAIIDGKCPPTLVMPNQPAINAHAKSVRDTMPVPGVRFFAEKQAAFRR